MKKIISTLIVFAFLANLSAQLKVNSSGEIKNTANVPITFKVNNSLAGFTGSSANSNVSFGYRALNPLTGGSNVAIGFEALFSNTTGYQNTAIGGSTLRLNTTGINNVACGDNALYYNIEGNYNTASGWGALRFNTNGDYNAATGMLALYSNTTGGRNTASGLSALFNSTTGSFNTAIGCHTLYTNTVGNNNTAIGSFADVNAINLTNATAIGYNAKALTSDQVVIGNTKVMSILGYNSLTIISDGRAKKNIRTEVPGLAFINHLQPITYNLDLDALDELQKSDDLRINELRDSLLMARSPEEKEIDAKAKANKEKQVYSGFIAQDVEKVAQSVGYDFSGVDAPKNGKGAYGLRYAEFVVPLVKAVQELSEQNARLQEQINELKKDATLRSATNETETTGMVDAVVAQCKLFQNAPNPFNQSTEIKYYLPEDVKTAYLCIYNLQGTQIKQIRIMLRGEGSQIISGSELAAGMYLYALIVDGREVDTKRMILTK
ncbi:MAG: tail fiber domain-containing protein [Dysgonamonadaceae bacterium]|jgi:hypothetical protein|nr:tail fiber domain-containing protein [Dysgonamonadaceae bacterium]